MDKEALETIVETVVGATGLPAVASQKATVLPGSMKVESLERYNTTRYRYRGVFATSLIEEFGNYINGYATDYPADQDVYINPDKLSAKCILDLGTPEAAGHCDHIASLTLARTNAFIAIVELSNSRSLDQLEAIELLEDWNDFIACYNGDDLIPNAAAIAAFRGVKQSTDAQSQTEIDHHSRKTSALASIDVTARSGNLPTHIQFNCRPYDGLDLRDFKFSVYLRTGETPSFKFRWIAEEQTKEAIAQEFKTLVHEQAQPNFSVLIGTLTT